MQKPSDERLIAYLDGEVDERERAEIAWWLEQDEGLRERAGRLAESAAVLRAAFDEVLREPLPERLIAAARGDSPDKVTNLAVHRMKRLLGRRRWWIGVPIAASIAGLVVGYFAGNQAGTDLAEQQEVVSPAGGTWLDSIAGYHKLFVAAGANDVALADVPPTEGDAAHKVAQKLPPDFRVPNLKPWGLAFQGARFIFIEGRPGTQLFYTTDNQALGPLTVIVANSNRGELQPTFARRDDVNMLYWRHHGHAYALVGTADIGYLWNIHNDIAWQLDAI
jgi:anti-sigma factor RsiW